MLESIYKKSSHWLYLFLQTIISFLKILIRFKLGTKLPPIENSNCVILGNGPSLKQSLEQDVELIKQYDTVCVNNFAYSEYFDVIKPKNYVLLDGYYFIFDNEKNNRKDVKGTFDKIEKISWKINVFIPLKGKSSYLYKNILKANKNISIFFFNYNVIKGFKFFNYFFFKHRIAMPQCQNILAAALLINVNRKYKRIYLLGADHSWHENYIVNANNEITLSQQHFYDTTVTSHEVVKDYVHHTKVTMASIFLSLYKAFNCYYIIGDYAKFMNVEIINSSKKSYIDAFEKKPIN